MNRDTIFSPDRVYRYTLWRSWDGLLGNGSYAMFIGLNPSTADEVRDDPTIRRCIAFAKRWHLGALCMTNIFAYRATDPRVMKAVEHPAGPDNDNWLTRCAQSASIVVAAWGTHGSHLGRDREVMQLIPPGRASCLGITKDGYPRHPLYVRGDARLIEYRLP